MATVTGMTAAAMQAIRDGTVVSAAINGSGHLILTKHDGTTVDAGVATGPAGAAGATGPAGPSALASGAQITWGADVNLYRSAADVLKTDDAFVAALGYSLGAPLAAPAYQSQQIAAQTVLRNKLLAADANDAFHVLGSGKLEWGAGGATAIDTNLYRSAADVLKTDDAFISVLGISVPALVGTPAYAASQVAAQTVLRNKLLAADANDSFHILGDGKLEWGAGGASTPDTTLYRSNPSVLKTDGYLRLGQNIVTNVGAAAQFSAGDVGPSSQAGLTLGSAGDTNLYRSAADTLKTDDSLVVGGSLTVTGSFSPNSVSIPAIVGTPAYAAAQVAAQTVIRNKLLTADANDSFHVQGDGKLEWGAGGATAVDTNLYRSGADSLKTDDYFGAAFDGYFRHSAGTQTIIGAAGPGSQSGLSFGSAGDTNLYRSAADTLKTDDSLVVGGTITLPTNNHVLSDVNGSYAKFSKGLIIDGGNFIVGNGTVGGALYFGGGTSSFQVSNATPSLVSLVGGSLLIPAIAGSPAYAAAQVAAQTVLRNKLLAADANDSFHILGDGKLEWGSGGATAVDTSLYRNSSNSLVTSGYFAAMANIYGNFTAAGQTIMGGVGPGTSSGITFGSAGDTNLYRSAADTLKTDDSILVAGGIGSTGMTPNTAVSFFGLRTASQILLANNISAVSDANASFIIQGDGKHEWGVGTVTARDTNLYRSAADTLKTDDKFVAASGLNTSADSYFYVGGANQTFIGNQGGKGAIQFGSAGDTNLYRDAADTLKTDDGVWAAGGVVTKTKAGIPTDSDLVTGMQQSGAIIIDETNSRIYVRVGTTWKYAALI